MSSMSAEARTILSTAHHGTHRPLLAWAAGVAQCGHAMDPYRYWTSRDATVLAPSYTGWTLERGRKVTMTRARIEITGPDLPRPLRLTWEEVAAVLAGGRVTPALIRACWEALGARRAHEPWTPGWTEIEDACSAAGEAVWAVCRPADPGEQLDLFVGLPGLG